MIKFFRKIRQNLLSKNNIGKYLKYAIGEILLVVIGILIALQINNWNENKKAKLYEHKMLIEVLEDLKSDSTLIQTQFRRIERFEESIDQITNDPTLLKNNPEMISLFGGVYLVQNTKAIETIKSGNINIPFDDELRKLINNHYHRSKFFLELLSFEDKDFREFRSIPLQKSHFIVQVDSTSEAFDLYSSPLNYEGTINSRDFKDYLLLRKSRVMRWKSFYERIYISTMECINSISNYLE
ncbi:MAG: hypothetical protein JJ895_04740 [Balneolaceae bacterium]|nr:hypothetical protein [Balneolaceae bacterium]